MCSVTYYKRNISTLEETYKFCCRCGAAVDKEEVVIRYYVERGFP